MSDIAEPTQLAGVRLDFDHWSSKMTYSPWDVWARLRNECPVAYSPNHGGFFVLSRYADIYSAVLDPATFSSDGGGNGVGIPPQEARPLYPVDADPPLHTQYRNMLNPWLKPRAVAALEPWIRDTARRLIGDFPVGEVFDVAERFTLVYPRLVAFYVLGFPPEDMQEISGYIDKLATERAEGGAASAALFGKLTAAVQGRRTNPRRDDILDAIVFGKIDGQPLSDSQIMAVLALLLFGGLGTTSAAIGGMILWLADHPEDRARLREEPGLKSTAIDEFVRWTSPVAHIGRTATRDTETGGCPVNAGDRILFAYGSANRDPAQFDRADEVLLDRHPNRHIGFGMGPHRCIGSHLAKLQMRVALEEILASAPNFRIGDYGGIRWAPGETRFICNLPLLIEPAA